MISNPKFFLAFLFGILALSPSCNKKARNETSQSQNFRDGEVFTKLKDGNYSVVCSNNTTEIHSLEAITKSANDPNDQTVCDPRRKLRCIMQMDSGEILPRYVLASVSEGTVTQYGTLSFASSSQCQVIADAAFTNQKYRCWMLQTQQILPVYALYQFTSQGFIPVQEEMNFSSESQCTSFYDNFSKSSPKSKQCGMVRTNAILPQYSIWEFDLATHRVERFAGNQTLYPSLSQCESILN